MQGLTDLQMVRMKATADQLLTTSNAANQWPKRDFALFHVLYATAMRVSELIQLDIDRHVENLLGERRSWLSRQLHPARTS